jgi:hypothetical protein
VDLTTAAVAVTGAGVVTAVTLMDHQAGPAFPAAASAAAPTAADPASPSHPAVRVQ